MLHSPSPACLATSLVLLTMSAHLYCTPSLACTLYCGHTRAQAAPKTAPSPGSSKPALLCTISSTACPLPCLYSGGPVWPACLGLFSPSQYEKIFHQVHTEFFPAAVLHCADSPTYRLVPSERKVGKWWIALPRNFITAWLIKLNNSCGLGGMRKSSTRSTQISFLLLCILRISHLNNLQKRCNLYLHFLTSFLFLGVWFNFTPKLIDDI